MINRADLDTEKQNNKTLKIDTLSTIEIVKTINVQDAKVAAAVGKEKLQIAKAVDIIVKSFQSGGRLFYVGAGTSGRLGVLDASECPPTFGVSHNLVQGIIAGGRKAVVRAVEGAEDNKAAGADALKKKKLKQSDVAVGIAASGITPFVHSAIEYAKKAGCPTIFITCSKQAVGHIKADIIINPIVGAEVITGSTRMKAATATKLVLNTLTTAAMIKIGKVYGNLMVDLKATNEKLKDRSIRIITTITGLSRQDAQKLLKKAKGKVKTAVVIHFRDVNFQQAEKILKQNNGLLAKAVKPTTAAHF